MAGFFTNCVKNVIEKAVSICVIIQQDCKVKRKLQLHNQSFEHNGMEICDQQRLEGLEKKKGGAHFLQARRQKNLQNFIPKDDRPANSGDANTLVPSGLSLMKQHTKIHPPKHWTS